MKNKIYYPDLKAICEDNISFQDAIAFDCLARISKEKNYKLKIHPQGFDLVDEMVFESLVRRTAYEFVQ